ncbi:MAG: hypothetical protein R6W75_06430 [Smithellaceae bacterium]
MLVHIIRKDNQYDYIQDFMLENLIEAKEITKFKRGSGWVTIGTHQTRGKRREKVMNGVDRIAVNDEIFIREYRRARA